MEQVLRGAGVAVRPYPTENAAVAKEDAVVASRLLVAAGTAWEREIERLYAIHMQKSMGVLHADYVGVLSGLCATHGLDVAVRELNHDVGYRYTALYKRIDLSMVNVCLADKNGEPRPDFLASVPLTSSFCQYVLRDGSFLTKDSARDGRLDGHPYQGTMAAYCGVPVFDEEGVAVGTLCHFDVVERQIADPDLERLRAAAGVFASFFPA